ncbi:phasin family protein [Siccirubricoccus phaeus]|uniref:phasin family protein n=1 Tax=Siccirubricoccus phaeus TaxID=2595053 RepID=UPI0011F39020|nr:TIGR01841 family phasin [Siccirubricoccus phaeus]
MADNGFRPDQDLTRMLAEFRLPRMPDLDTLAAAQRRNLEALSAANRVALEGAQAVARRHMEILQSAMADMTEAMSGLTAQETPQAKAARQAELLKATYEKAVANMREVADLIQKSNAEALALLNKRFTEAMDEVKQLMAKQG